MLRWIVNRQIHYQVTVDLIDYSEMGSSPLSEELQTLEKS